MDDFRLTLRGAHDRIPSLSADTPRHRSSDKTRSITVIDIAPILSSGCGSLRRAHGAAPHRSREVPTFEREAMPRELAARRARNAFGIPLEIAERPGTEKTKDLSGIRGGVLPHRRARALYLYACNEKSHRNRRCSVNKGRGVQDEAMAVERRAGINIARTPLARRKSRQRVREGCTDTR